MYISCKCDTNRAGHFTLDAYAQDPLLVCFIVVVGLDMLLNKPIELLVIWDQGCLLTRLDTCDKNQ